MSERVPTSLPCASHFCTEHDRAGLHYHFNGEVVALDLAAARAFVVCCHNSPHVDGCENPAHRPAQ